MVYGLQINSMDQIWNMIYLRSICGKEYTIHIHVAKKIKDQDKKHLNWGIKDIKRASMDGAVSGPFIISDGEQRQLLCNISK